MNPAQQGNPIAAFFPLVLMFVIFYFLLIRPQQQKEKQRKQLIAELKKGDRVVTTGGILGDVLAVHDDYIVLRIGDKDSKLEVLKSAISGKVAAPKA